MANSVLAKMAVIISANTAEFNRNLKQSETQFQRFTGAITKVGGLLGGVFGGVAVFQGIKAGIGIMANFEHTMSEVKAITGATGNELESLEKDAKKLGASTKFTATQVGQLQIAYGRLGFTTSEILDATKATLDLAAATGEDLAKSADVAGSTVRGFGLDASETLRVVDVMASSFNKTALGLDNFTESMKYVAPVAKAAGATVEETTALLGVLADSGIRGSMAGTSLRKIFTDMTRDGRPLKERLKELGDRGITLADSFDEVGRTAQTSLLILSKNTKKTDELTSALQNARGEADKMARTMEDDLIGDFTKLQSAFEGLILSSGGITDVLREVTQNITKLVVALTASDGALGTFIANWVRLVSVIPRTLIEGLGKLAEIFGPVTEKEVEEAIIKLKELRDAAKMEGNQEEVQMYTKFMADLVAKYGLLKDKSLELKEEITQTNTEALEPQIGIIQAIEERLKFLNEAKKNAFSVAQIALFNAEIDELKNKLDALNSTLPGAERRKEQRPLNSQNITGAGFLFDVGALDTAAEQTDAALSRINTSLIKNSDSLENWVASAKIAFENYQNSLVDFSGVVNSALSGIGQALGNAISGSEKLGDGLLKVLGGVLVQLGGMLITAGLGVEAFKKSLQSLNGFIAIAAGVALVAIGTAVSGSIKSLGDNPTGRGSGRASSGRNNNFGDLNNRGLEIQLGGEWRIKGEDLVYVFNRQNQLNGRTRG